MSKMGDYVTSGKNRNVVFYPGSESWRFVDETGELSERYNTEEEALAALAEYEYSLKCGG